ncbi:hypothetical protein [Treponema sp.]|uniref:hypothetical protein n=1 Tax=Treponema sp. TaxID=166 RepID=UPI0025D10ED1|nr:hypothetical protein [Treponema sp.]MBR4322883.1 hypothetical protein [Treponema sp.]
MSYEALFEQIRSVPESCLNEISNYINYVVYRYEKQNSAAERFAAVCAEAQAWAKDVGITEQDIKDNLKALRAEKRRA